MRLPCYIAAYVFWLSLATITYTYFVYPVVLFFCYAIAQLRRDFTYLVRRVDRRVRALAESNLPSVSFVIAAYNEEDSLPAKLRNMRSLGYPKDKLEVIFVSDGSTDRTNEILQEAAVADPAIHAMVLPQRGGKPLALNRAVSEARNEILVLSDAGTLFDPDAVRKLVRHFCDSSVGAVCGALRFEASAESQQTEGVYWKYETMLRLMEARLGATLTASGAIYAMRRSAFVPFLPGTLIEDLIAPMNVRGFGLRVVYDPEAVATDIAADSVRGEFRRRVRIALGSFRALPQISRLRLSGFALFAFLSHKVLRWFVPHFALMMLVSNSFLLASRFYALAFSAHIAFLAWAGIGFLWRERLRHVRFALLGYFLFAMNLAFLIGFVRSLGNSREGTW
jgi:cellulose synthase/poly-beta-1,6-N-acetylglucosamine synthase-like glycosyltransferase